MTIYKNEPVIRFIGSVVAFGFLVMGLYAIFGASSELPELNQDRAFWFGITSIIASVFALVLSWLIKDIRGVWCAPPRRNIFDD
ncbi:MAG: hypothetical protein HOE62_14790 [Alphaproteobacteria bacterium]|jgi:hypothetical protein|nr:hypothetical protein [Alphaproteobacteria bacterium]MBT4019217.1 hypothetical protein [Alphaproteobacteria bacterium]MBT4967240.1 hypothetical protein [Alphaproteobacteria bacterium]MBT5160829.1 hypothetical protein [Alphaproteobacteria bacterium]MBT5917546.1 hypothetical protein [Alphaproteobacteria bacterium]